MHLISRPLSRRQLFVQAGLTSMTLLGSGALLASCSAGETTAASAAIDLTVTQVNDLATRQRQQGFTPIALSIYGAPGDRRFATAWQYNPKVDWEFQLALNRASLADYLTQIQQKGWSISALTTVSDENDTLFALAVLKTSGGQQRIAYDLPVGSYDQPNEGNPQTWSDYNAWARANDYLPVAAAIYGPDSDQRFAGVWAPNTAKIAWNQYMDTYSPADTAVLRDTMATMRARPVFISRTMSGHFLTGYRDDDVGDWQVEIDLGTTDFARRLQALQSQGYAMIAVEAAGIDSASRRFTGIWVKAPKGRAPQFTTDGTLPSVLNGVDEAMQAMMRSRNAHAGVFALAYQNRLIAARGYTLAGPGYPRTLATSRFRCASLSKVLTGQAITKLIALQPANFPRGLDTPVQSILNLTGPNGSAIVDPEHWNAITIRHLLLHKGGWAGGSIDPVFGNDPLILSAFPGRNYPITKQMMAQYMAGQPIQTTPGTFKWYSNFGYVLLGLLIEQVSGKSYEEWIRTNLAQPVGVTHMRIGQTEYSRRLPDEVTYVSDDQALYTPRSFLAGQPVTAFPYGAFILENTDAAAGWAITAPEYLRIMATTFHTASNPLKSSDPDGAGMLAGFDVTYPTKTGVTGCKGGSLPGTQAIYCLRSDDISYLYYVNNESPASNHESDPGTQSTIDGIIDAIQGGKDAWPQADLFASLIK